jgi:hypothetical protein
MHDGPLTNVEYRAFLNMWLCRFIFCGKANEPTLNHIAMAEDLATGHHIPLGKYLLGSVYHMLHQTTHLIYTSQKISCVNGSWWFVQMWLQLYMHQILGVNLNNRHFPSSDYKEGENQITKACQSYGEAASTIIIDQNISQLFELFFRGFTNPLWLPYLHNAISPFLMNSPLKMEAMMQDPHKFSISSFIHASCQQNFVEEGKIITLMSITSQI